MSQSRPPGRSATGDRPPASGPAAASGTGAWARASVLASDWAPVLGRILLALVLAWFGYHELVRPGLWTGYVPVVSPASSLAIMAVLIHGWLLLVLAVALAAGLATRLAALLAAVLLLEIVVSLTISGGLSDLTLRDAGVLGLAITLTGVSQQRLVLRR
jgi:uncharacterized membrane protein YphA (DoxX/SURF4 family)